METKRKRRRLNFLHEKFQGKSLLDHDDRGTVHVLVTFRNERGKTHTLSNFTVAGPAFDVISTVAGGLPFNVLSALIDDPDIQKVAEDGILRAAGEVIPYGITMTQYPAFRQEFLSRKSSYAAKQGVTGGSCADARTFKVAVIDSGMHARHPDLPCHDLGDRSRANCIGKTFGRNAESKPWDRPDVEHGTNVAGVIFAKTGNGRGIAGMVGDENICIISARVLDDDGTTLTSRMLEGIQWAVEQGAKVINLSMAGGDYVESVDAYFDELYYDEGVLVFAASGNDGESTEYSYPASFEKVVSVAAIKANKMLASFSQSNDQVDLSAPGYQILTTASPGASNVVSKVKVGRHTFAGKWLEQSRTPPEGSGFRATLVFCTHYGQNTCPGSGGHICLIERGGDSSWERKGESCQDSGGVAAIVFGSDDDGRLGGKLKSGSSVRIPMAVLYKEDGRRLVEDYHRHQVRLWSSDGYDFVDGTSMSSPHAAGAATALWKACGDACTNKDISRCLHQTALDLGDRGYDPQFGFGLIQMRDAAECLRIGNSVNVISPDSTTTGNTGDQAADANDGSISISACPCNGAGDCTTLLENDAPFFICVSVQEPYSVSKLEYLVLVQGELTEVVHAPDEDFGDSAIIKVPYKCDRRTCQAEAPVDPRFFTSGHCCLNARGIVSVSISSSDSPTATRLVDFTTTTDLTGTSSNAAAAAGQEVQTNPSRNVNEHRRVLLYACAIPILVVLLLSSCCILLVLLRRQRQERKVAQERERQRAMDSVVIVNDY